MKKTNNGTGIFTFDDIAEMDLIAKSNAEFEAEKAAKKELSQPQPTQSSEVILLLGWDSLEEE